MKATMEDNNICIDMWDIIDSLAEDSKKDLIDRLSCEDDVIHMVADQLIYGYTNDSSCGSSNCDASQTDTPLDKYTRLVAKLAGDVAKREIEELERKVASLKKDNSNLSKYTWRVYHQFKLKITPSDAIKGKTIGRWGY